MLFALTHCSFFVIVASGDEMICSNRVSENWLIDLLIGLMNSRDQ
jgi:hypothetical protein